MWFLKNKPEKIDINALIYSYDKGYQITNYRFKVSSQENEKFRICIAFPWSPNKENGSFEIIQEDLLSIYDEKENNKIIINEKDIKIYEKIKLLKREQDIDLLNIHELIEWYIDDIGIISLWINSGETYQINYKHKIAVDSCLFLPTKIPSILLNKNVEINCKVWVINSLLYDLPKYINKEKYNLDEEKSLILQQKNHTLDLLTFNKWNWDNDLKIHTDNWESSGDEISDLE